MKNNNGDLPVMPIELSGFGQFAPEVHCGMSKRELIAKDVDVFRTFENYFTSYNKMEDFLGRELDFSSAEQCLIAEFDVMAKLKLMATDALLAELDK